jgi:hypothetical protein
MSPVPGHGRPARQAEVEDMEIRGASWRRTEFRPAASRRQRLRGGRFGLGTQALESKSDPGHASSGSVQGLWSPTLPKASAI